MLLECANERCSNPVPARCRPLGPNRTSATGLCGSCNAIWRYSGLPIGGYVPADTLTAVARHLLENLQPSASQVATAERYARGPRHTYGNWQERPVHSMSKLIYGRGRQRIGNLMMGRKSAPGKLEICKAFCHYTLASSVLGTYGLYNSYLAGCTLMGRRGTHIPPGRKGEVNPVRAYPGGTAKRIFMYETRDFILLGGHALRTASILGLEPNEASAEVIAALHEATLEGGLRRQVVVPRFAMPTLKAGDHPLAHKLGPKADVPFRYQNSIRRADGKIAGRWPVGIERVPALLPPPKPVPPPTPNTDWLFHLSN